MTQPQGWQALLILSCNAEQAALTAPPARRDALMEQARRYLDMARETDKRNK